MLMVIHTDKYYNWVITCASLYVTTMDVITEGMVFSSDTIYIGRRTFNRNMPVSYWSISSFYSVYFEFQFCKSQSQSMNIRFKK